MKSHFGAVLAEGGIQYIHKMKQKLADLAAIY